MVSKWIFLLKFFENYICAAGIIWPHRVCGIGIEGRVWSGSLVFAQCYRVFTSDEGSVCLISGARVQARGKAKVRLCCVTLVTLSTKYIKSQNGSQPWQTQLGHLLICQISTDDTQSFPFTAYPNPSTWTPPSWQDEMLGGRVFVDHGDSQCWWSGLSKHHLDTGRTLGTLRTTNNRGDAH